MQGPFVVAFVNPDNSAHAAFLPGAVAVCWLAEAVDAG